MKEKSIKTVLDIGCGDWQFSKLINWNKYNYTGIDCVQSLIDSHNKQYAANNIKFQYMDIFQNYDSLPEYDLILLKDVIQHWPNEKIRKILPELLKKAKYILITNCRDQQHDDEDCDLGDFRQLSYKMKPLSEFNPILIYRYNTKEIILIKGNYAEN